MRIVTAPGLLMILLLAAACINFTTEDEKRTEIRQSIEGNAVDAGNLANSTITETIAPTATPVIYSNWGRALTTVSPSIDEQIV